MTATIEKLIEFKKQVLLKQLQGLLDQLESNKLSSDQLTQLKTELSDCQRRFQELGFKSEP